VLVALMTLDGSFGQYIQKWTNCQKIESGFNREAESSGPCAAVSGYAPTTALIRIYRNATLRCAG
jgi:hypothetical protein